MKLFLVVMKSKNTYDKLNRNLYVIQETKELAAEYVNENKKDMFEIKRIKELGYELSARMFKGGKESETWRIVK